MSMTVDTNYREALKQLGTVLVSLLRVQVILGYENRTPMPDGDFIAMSLIRTERQSTNETYCPVDGSRADLLFSAMVVQLDCYGVNAHTLCTNLLMLLRSDLMSEHGINSLFSSDPLNIPFTDAENQQAQRWTVDAQLQFNTVWTLPQDSALTITIPPINNVDMII